MATIKGQPLRSAYSRHEKQSECCPSWTATIIGLTYPLSAEHTINGASNPVYLGSRNHTPSYQPLLAIDSRRHR